MIFIFGTGYHGRAAFRVCKRINVKIYAFLDNDKKKISNLIFKRRIFHPLELKKKNYNNATIILCGRNITDQHKQLKKINQSLKIKIWGYKKLIQSKKQIDLREKKIKEILLYVINILNKNDISYWIDRSGLLSIMRKEKFSLISDIDIGVNFRENDKLFNLFNSNKFQIEKTFNFKKKIIKLSFKSKNNIFIFEPGIIDFIFYIFGKEKAIQFGNKKKYVKKKFLLNLENVKKYGINLKIPSTPKKYLKSIYGKNWIARPNFYRNPQKNHIKNYA